MGGVQRGGRGRANNPPTVVLHPCSLVLTHPILYAAPPLARRGVPHVNLSTSWGPHAAAEALKFTGESCPGPVVSFGTRQRGVRRDKVRPFWLRGPSSLHPRGRPLAALTCVHDEEQNGAEHEGEPTPVGHLQRKARQSTGAGATPLVSLSPALYVPCTPVLDALALSHVPCPLCPLGEAECAKLLVRQWIPCRAWRRSRRPGTLCRRARRGAPRAGRGPTPPS